MAAAKKKQTERVQKAIEYVKKRLRLDHEFIVGPGEPQEQFGLLDIERSERGTEDKKTWVVSFHPDLVAKESMQALRRHAFHEMLHAITWPLFDEVETAIKRIPDAAIRKELMNRALDARENIVYDLERKVGPLAFPHLPWSEP